MTTNRSEDKENKQSESRQKKGTQNQNKQLMQKQIWQKDDHKDKKEPQQKPKRLQRVKSNGQKEKWQ